MAIDKALNQAPLGLTDEMMLEAAAEPDLEIEIEDPEEVTIRAGGMEIEIEPGKEVNDDFNANLAEDMELARMIREDAENLDEEGLEVDLETGEVLEPVA